MASVAPPRDLGMEQDIDFEEELERERHETPLSEMEEDDAPIDDKNGPRMDDPEGETEEEPSRTAEDKYSQINSYNKSTRVLTAAEQTLKSQILLLCSALGGIDQASDRKEYVLGSDALACLKDLKRWIKAVDDATHTWHVSAACHENSLVENDLVPIMIEVPRKMRKAAANGGASGSKPYYQNVMLSTLELLVALTKPLVLDIEGASASQIDLYMRLKKAYVKSKDRILNYQNGKVLKSVVSTALPILALPKEERSGRDAVILNLCLHFFRNIIRIEPADFTVSRRKTSTKTQQIVDNMPPGVSKEDVAFDNVLFKFKKNKVLTFIQTIAAGLGTEFDSGMLAPVCLDIYFYLLYGVNPESLVPQQQGDGHGSHKVLNPSNKNSTASSETGSKLAELMEQEREIKKQLFGNNMTRHANFGTLLSIRESKDESSLTVGTQRGMLHADPLEELDSGISKKLAASRVSGNQKESTKSDFDTRLESANKKGVIGRQAGEIIRDFCSDFTEAGFGVILAQIRRLATSDGSSSLGAFTDYHFLYVMQWMLKYERLMRGQSKNPQDFKRLGYQMVCLEEQMLRMLMVSSLPRYHGTREYNLLRVAVGCFKEILLTVMDIHQLEKVDKSSLSPEDVDEIENYVSTAEAVLRNIFASEDVIDVLFRIPQDANKVSLAYACDMVDFTHVLFKVLHYLSGLKIPIVLGKKVRKTRKKFYGPDHDPSLGDSGSEDEGDEEFNVNDPAKLKRYQILDKQRYAGFEERLLNEHVVDTHVWVFSRFAELNDQQVHLCVSYFTRILLKWKEHFLKLVRLDFMLTLHDFKHAHFMSQTMKESNKLLSYFMRILEKLHKHSEKILMEATTQHETHDTDVALYLLGGSLSDVRQKQEQFRALDLRFADDNMSYSYKISVLVSQLLYADKSDNVETLIKLLEEYKDARLAWESNDEMDDSIRPPQKCHLTEKFIREERKDAKLRLLLRTIGFIGNDLPTDITTDQISQVIGLMQVALENPLDSFEIEGKIVTEGVEMPEAFREPSPSNAVVVQRVGVTDHEADNLERNDDRETHHGYGEFAVDDDDIEMADDLAGDYAEDNLDLMEARLEANEKRVKGVAMKKKKTKKRSRRRKDVDSEDDDPLPTVRRKSKKRKHKRGKQLPMHEGVEQPKKKKEETPHQPHLSSKYVDSDADDSDSEAEREFFAREERLRQLVAKNGDKPITPEQFTKMFDLSDSEDDMMRESNGEEHSGEPGELTGETVTVSELDVASESAAATESASESAAESEAAVENGQEADEETDEHVHRRRAVVLDSDDE